MDDKQKSKSSLSLLMSGFEPDSVTWAISVSMFHLPIPSVGNISSSYTMNYELEHEPQKFMSKPNVHILKLVHLDVRVGTHPYSIKGYRAHKHKAYSQLFDSSLVFIWSTNSLILFTVSVAKLPSWIRITKMRTGLPVWFNAVTPRSSTGTERIV